MIVIVVVVSNLSSLSILDVVFPEQVECFFVVKETSVLFLEDHESDINVVLLSIFETLIFPVASQC